MEYWAAYHSSSRFQKISAEEERNSGTPSMIRLVRSTISLHCISSSPGKESDRLQLPRWCAVLRTSEIASASGRCFPPETAGCRYIAASRAFRVNFTLELHFGTSLWNFTLEESESEPRGTNEKPWPSNRRRGRTKRFFGFARFKDHLAIREPFCPNDLR